MLVALVHCWWEGRVVHLLWETAWQPLKGLNTELPRDLLFLLLGMCPRAMTIHVRAKNSHMNIHSSIIHNVQNEGKTQITTN